MEDSAASGTRVQVVVRVRPVLPIESSESVAVSVAQDGARVQVQLPDRVASGSKDLLPGTARMGARSYGFDACLPGRTTQAELCEVCGLEQLVEQALEGYSVTVLAFGQTGSGKTYTMVGPRLSRSQVPPPLPAPPSVTGTAAAAPAVTASVPSTPPAQAITTDEEEDGLMPRCIAAAFAGVRARAASSSVQVSVSCLELYNEAVSDLLAGDKSKQLQVRRDEREGFRVDGLRQVPCASASAAVAAMGRALVHRHTRSHALNEYSSRSHCIMAFTFDIQDKDGGDATLQGAQGGVRRRGRLTLVDLAGSERLKESGSSGREAVRETGSINKSLFVLGQVLAALAAKSSGGGVSGGPGGHVPYRDSKLTQLLWGSLRGDGRVLMLACLNPLASQAEETLNTLHFASMALRIKSRPVVLLDPQDALVLELRTTIRKLQEENRQLATAMGVLSSGGDMTEVLAALPEHLRLTAQRSALTSAPSAAAGSPGVGGTVKPRPQLEPDVLTLSASSLGARNVVNGPGGSIKSQSKAASGSGSPWASPGTPSRVGGGGRGAKAARSPGAAGRLRMSSNSAAGTGATSGSHSPAPQHGAAPGLAADLAAFPELAALESEFQALLAGGGMSGAGQVMRSAAPPAPPPPVPEPKALEWAERNTWFGSDAELTAFAYQVHDELVQENQVAAGSDPYYAIIDARVSERFPERYAEWQARAAAAAAQPAKGGKSPTRPKAKAFPSPGSHNVGGALRTLLKDPITWEGQVSGRASNLYVPLRGYANPKHTAPNGIPSQLPSLSLPSPPKLPEPPASPTRPSRGLPAVLTASPSSAQAAQLPQTSGSPLLSQTPSGSVASPVRGRSRQQPATSRQAGARRSLQSQQGGVAGMLRRLKEWPVIAGADAASPTSPTGQHWTWEEMQREYMRQRRAVLEELRLAKDEAEAERARIMTRIGNTLSNSRWRA